MEFGFTNATSIWPAYNASITAGAELKTLSFIDMLLELLPEFIAFLKVPFSNPIMADAWLRFGKYAMFSEILPLAVFWLIGFLELSEKPAREAQSILDVEDKITATIITAEIPSFIAEFNYK